MAEPKRVLHPEMKDWIYHVNERDGLFHHNIAEKKDPRGLLCIISPKFVGVREKTGKNDGRQIELFQETIGGAAREPYCLSGAQTMIAFVEMVYGITSPIYATEHCMTCWRKTDQRHRVQYAPNPGALGIYNHKGTDSGHATMFIEGVMETTHGVRRKYAHNVEWNTTSGDKDGEIVREGGGVYWTKRPWLKNVGSMIYIGHLKPF